MDIPMPYRVCFRLFLRRIAALIHSGWSVRVLSVPSAGRVRLVLVFFSPLPVLLRREIGVRVPFLRVLEPMSTGRCRCVVAVGLVGLRCALISLGNGICGKWLWILGGHSYGVHASRLAGV